jgi:site-specific DNA recombinase
LEAEEQRLGRELAGHQREMQQLIKQLSVTSAGSVATEMANIQDRVQTAERRLIELRDERARLNHELIDDTEAAKAMAAFDPLWETLNFREQARLLQLLIERIEYDGREGTISITFLPSGIRALANRDFTGDAV